jgi:hypothetical protein
MSFNPQANQAVGGQSHHDSFGRRLAPKNFRHSVIHKIEPFHVNPEFHAASSFQSQPIICRGPGGGKALPAKSASQVWRQGLDGFFSELKLAFPA